MSLGSHQMSSNKDRYEVIVYEKWHERRGMNNKEIETVGNEVKEVNI